MSNAQTLGFTKHEVSVFNSIVKKCNKYKMYIQNRTQSQENSKLKMIKNLIKKVQNDNVKMLDYHKFQNLSTGLKSCSDALWKAVFGMCLNLI